MSEQRSYGRVFAEALIFGAGIVIAGGALKYLWGKMTGPSDGDALDGDDNDDNDNDGDD